MDKIQKNNWDCENLLHADLVVSKNIIYVPSHFECSQPVKEEESVEYGAYTFKLNVCSIAFRVSKITPAKAGQFVTLWKRIGNSPIQPYDMDDLIDIFVICARQGNHFGQFIFSKTVLQEHGVISTNGEGGKRAIRIYPPWEKSLNKQAQKTQCWQLQYFLDASQDKSIDYTRVQELYSLL